MQGLFCPPLDQSFIKLMALKTNKKQPLQFKPNIWRKLWAWINNQLMQPTKTKFSTTSSNHSWWLFSNLMLLMRSDKMQRIKWEPISWRWFTSRKWSPRFKLNSDRSWPWENWRKMSKSKKRALLREHCKLKELQTKKWLYKNLNKDLPRKVWLQKHSTEPVTQSIKNLYHAKE